jgi:hypothetical protein
LPSGVGRVGPEARRCDARYHRIDLLRLGEGRAMDRRAPLQRKDGAAQQGKAGLLAP